MVIKRLISTALALATSLPAAAGELLSLAEALARGRERAPAVAAAAARNAASTARLRAASGYRLPTVRLSESFVRTDAPADAFGLLLNQERFSFPEFVAGDPNDPDPLDTAISRVELELPIWTGGEISTRIEQAELVAEASRISAERAADSAAAAAGEAWLMLARAREVVALLERSRATVAAHVEQARAYAAQGMLVRSELLRAEVELSAIDDLLAEASGGAEVAQSALAHRLGDPVGSSYELAPLEAPAGDLEPLERWLAASATHPDLAAARKRLEAGALEAKAIRAGLWPRIGLAARHDWYDDSLFGSHGSSATIAAAATLELFDGGRRRAAAAAADAEAEAGRSELESFESGVALEVRGAFTATSSALDRHATALAALDAAAEALRIVEDRFRSGIAKTLDVLDAATARREAEMRELLSRADVRAALLRLALAAGSAPEATFARDVDPESTVRPLRSTSTFHSEVSR